MPMNPTRKRGSRTNRTTIMSRMMKRMKKLMTNEDKLRMTNESGAEDDEGADGRCVV